MLTLVILWSLPTLEMFPLGNTLIEQGATINMMNTVAIEILQLPNRRPTPTALELENLSKIKPVGILKDVIVYLDS